MAVPMLLYFSIMWTGTFFGARHMGSRYENAVVQAFTASSNNFELAIAVAVGVFGINSKVTLFDQSKSLTSLIYSTQQDVVNCIIITMQVSRTVYILIAALAAEAVSLCLAPSVRNTS